MNEPIVLPTMILILILLLLVILVAITVVNTKNRAIKNNSNEKMDIDVIKRVKTLEKEVENVKQSIKR
ncbi:hypothetical protein [Ornithinibacillus scapharcae]|uniref:hypothetical protein n=1 Tax=Ornithinibacillus scapharcae TaxID=1147159 RepID=UPI000225B567|nr:hypothetical protein [Ornithinibacillus scapharcae]